MKIEKKNMYKHNIMQIPQIKFIKADASEE